jgi:hypothetical protein
MIKFFRGPNGNQRPGRPLAKIPAIAASLNIKRKDD